MKTTKVFLSAFFLTVAIGLSAQPGNPSNPTPIGGVALLAAAGAALGAKKVYDAKK